MTSTLIGSIGQRALLLLAIGFAAALPGCRGATIAAAGAAAGAATGIYLTTRGAESVVDGPVADVEKRARAVLAAEGIPVEASDTESSGTKREIKGTKGDLDISVSMEQQGAQTTKTEVTARKNVAVWDKEYAEQLLQKIVKQS
jgi:hypothetical protein